MRDLLKLLAVCVLAVVVGSVVNGAIITIGPRLIPPPEGADMTTAEGIAAAMPLLQPRHFLAPFVAHAAGTLVAAFLGARLLPQRRLSVGAVVGLLFLAGGIAASQMIPAPGWFVATDLLLAYLPMAWLGVRLAQRNPNSSGKPTTTNAAHPA